MLFYNNNKIIIHNIILFTSLESHSCLPGKVDFCTMGIKMLQGWAYDQSNQTDNCVKHLNKSFSKKLLIFMSQKLIKLYINRMINIKITYTIHVYLLFSRKTIITRCILNLGICMYNAIMGKNIAWMWERYQEFPNRKILFSSDVLLGIVIFLRRGEKIFLQ